MMENFTRLVLVLGMFLILCPSMGSSHGHFECESMMIEESYNCSRVYEKGGAPAVFQSLECPGWSLSTEEAIRKQTENCQKHHSYKLQGRRQYQEDRTLCAVDLHIPFLTGIAEVKEVEVAIVAVFDGHGGTEASEMASKLLLDYFLLHVHFLRENMYSVALENSIGVHGLDLERFKWVLPETFNRSFHKEILKESLLRAIYDIDATFSEEAFRNNVHSGSTAIVVLIVDNQILVSNVGDSKAILCSKKFQSPQEVKEILLKYRQRKRNGDLSAERLYEKLKMVASSDGLKRFSVKELTRDHHPDRDDERSRVESAGGYIEVWGVPRVNGQLAVSRSIGDVSLKSYGVIAVPEVTDWQPLTGNDSYLVAASDGIFERMTTQDVCDLLWDVHTPSFGTTEIFSSCTHSLAECIVNSAFESGSMDNMAAVVVPLK